MITPIMDLILYLLLIIGVGFAGIGIIGIFIFPDLHSRQFTGIRASLISCGAMTLAGVLFAFFSYSTRGGAQYLTFTLHACLFLIVIIIVNHVAAQRILKKAPKMTRKSPQDPAGHGEPGDQPKNE